MVLWKCGRIFSRWSMYLNRVLGSQMNALFIAYTTKWTIFIVCVPPWYVASCHRPRSNRWTNAHNPLKLPVHIWISSFEGGLSQAFTLLQTSEASATSLLLSHRKNMYSIRMVKYGIFLTAIFHFTQYPKVCSTSENLLLFNSWLVFYCTKASFSGYWSCFHILAMTNHINKYMDLPIWYPVVNFLDT